MTLSSECEARARNSSRAGGGGTRARATMRGGSWAGTGFPAVGNLPTQQLQTADACRPIPYATHSSSVHCWEWHGGRLRGKVGRCG